MNTTKIVKCSILLSMVILFFSPQVTATNYTETRYCTTNILPINQPWLDLSNSAFPFYYEWNYTYAFGAPQSEYGIHAYLYYTNGSTTQITPALPQAVVIRTSDGEGNQSATWTCAETNTTKDASVYLEFWTRLRVIPFGGTAWARMGGGGYYRFQTEPLGATIISNATWNMTYYTYRLKDGTKYTHRIWFGDSTYITQVENFQYVTGDTLTYTSAVLLVAGFVMLPIIVLLGVFVKWK